VHDSLEYLKPLALAGTGGFLQIRVILRGFIDIWKQGNFHGKTEGLSIID
jgi:hypothetical protein